MKITVEVELGTAGVPDLSEAASALYTAAGLLARNGLQPRRAIPNQDGTIVGTLSVTNDAMGRFDSLIRG